MDTGTSASGGLDAHGVGVSLAGRPVLRDAGVRVGPGEVVALIAPSGAGKSTLLRCLVRLVPIDAGRITLDGVDVAALPPREVRRRIGLVAQSPAMLPGTVADNVGYALDGLAPERLHEALEAAGLPPSFAERTARELSGGERARTAFARALSRDPEVLLLDEPTAALDAETSARIGATLRRLAERGLGICLATHDVVFAEAWADRRVGL